MSAPTLDRSDYSALADTLQEAVPPLDGLHGAGFIMCLTRVQWHTIIKALRDADNPPVTRREIESLRELILNLSRFK